MNAQRRKDIRKIISRIEEVMELIADIQSDLDMTTSEEQEAFDNMPESLQYSERGEHMEEIISEMEDILSELEDESSNLLDLEDRLEEVIN